MQKSSGGLHVDGRGGSPAATLRRFVHGCLLIERMRGGARFSFLVHPPASSSRWAWGRRYNRGTPAHPTARPLGRAPRGSASEDGSQVRSATRPAGCHPGRRATRAGHWHASPAARPSQRERGEPGARTEARRFSSSAAAAKSSDPALLARAECHCFIAPNVCGKAAAQAPSVRRERSQRGGRSTPSAIDARSDAARQAWTKLARAPGGGSSLASTPLPGSAPSNQASSPRVIVSSAARLPRSGSGAAVRRPAWAVGMATYAVDVESSSSSIKMRRTMEPSKEISVRTGAPESRLRSITMLSRLLSMGCSVTIDARTLGA
eukprot:scaffold101486_cov28-Tisochrysis_lutea.AAC.1